MTESQIRVLAYLAIAALCFGSGWKVKGWQVDSENLAIERAAAAIRDQAMARESDIAEKIEQRLGELQANQTVIDRGIIRETEKPIYLRVCLEPGAIGLLNAAARGQAAPVPADPAGQVPGRAQPAQ